MSYKDEKWHILSHGQYFLDYLFLDICLCAFKISSGLVSVHVNGN